MRKSTNGFTIVELLIVIVVIAILASIATIAYANVRNRARYTQQVSKLDELGKAIRLYRAENGTTLARSGSGAAGDGYGGLYGVSPHANYTSISIHAMLAAAGYLQNFTQGQINTLGIGNVLLSPCTNLNDPRWVVVASITPPPPTTIDDQISNTGCTNSLITLYTDRDPNNPSNYGGNFVKVY